MSETTNTSIDQNPHTPSIESWHGERLTDRRMADLVSGVGNHANKLVLLAVMESDTVYSAAGDMAARKLLRDAQKGSRNEGWVPEYNVAFKYLANSLAPIGLVAKEVINEHAGTVGYQLTEAGEQIGVALAGYLLDFAERHNLALSQVFGDTVSSNPDERSGGLRWSIFQGLATQRAGDQMSITELARSVDAGMGRTAHSLPELAKINLLHYEAGKKRSQVYRIDTDGLREYIPRMRRSGSRDVAEAVIQSDIDAVSVSELAEIVTKDQPEGNTPELRSYLKTVLGNWEKIGITERVVDRGGDALVWVDEQQQAVLQELVEILDEFQGAKADVLAKGRSLARNIVNDPNRVAKLLAHEKEVSVHYHGQENAKKRGARVLEILRSTGTEMTYEEIRQQLEVMGDIVSIKGLARIVKQHKDVVVTSNESGLANKVTLADKS